MGGLQAATAASWGRSFRCAIWTASTTLTESLASTTISASILYWIPNHAAPGLPLAKPGGLGGGAAVLRTRPDDLRCRVRPRPPQYEARPREPENAGRRVARVSPRTRQRRRQPGARRLFTPTGLYPEAQGKREARYPGLTDRKVPPHRGYKIGHVSRRPHFIEPRWGSERGGDGYPGWRASRLPWASE